MVSGAVTPEARGVRKNASKSLLLGQKPLLPSFWPGGAVPYLTDAGCIAYWTEVHLY